VFQNKGGQVEREKVVTPAEWGLAMQGQTSDAIRWAVTQMTNLLAEIKKMGEIIEAQKKQIAELTAKPQG